MIHVEVVLCLGPRSWERVELAVHEGAAVADVLRLSSLIERHGLQPGHLSVGVWGRRQSMGHAVREGDRVEVYRPLQCDPKEARRLRYRRTPGKARQIRRLVSGGSDTPAAADDSRPWPPAWRSAAGAE